MKNIVLLVNPSYDTDIQKSFFSNLRQAINDINWRAVTLCNRSCHMDSATIFIKEQRLSKYSDREFANFPAWLTEDDINAYLEQELIYRNENRQTCSGAILNGLLYCANIIDVTFRRLAPPITILENKVYFFTSMAFLAARYYGSKTYITEKSPLMDIWVEEEGFFAETALSRKFAQRDTARDDYYKAVGMKVADKIYDQAQGFRSIQYAVERTKELLSSTTRPIFFFPFDNAHGTGLTANTHPQKKIDYKDLTIEGILKKVIKATEQANATLVIKSHPSYDLGLYFPQYAAYFYDNLDIDLMLKGSDVVIGMLSKTLFHALLYKKQVISLANSALSYAGFTHVAGEHEDWGQIFAKALQTGRVQNDNEDTLLSQETYSSFLTFMGWSSVDFFYGYSNFPNFCRKNIFTLLRSFPLGGASPLEMVAIDNEVESINKYINATSTTYRRKIYFDVSRLRSKKLAHTGISSFARTFLDYFNKREDTVILPTLSGSSLNRANDYTPSDFDALLNMKTMPLPLQQPDHAAYEQSIYFSPQDALPPAKQTVNHMRVLCVHDIFLYNVKGLPTSYAAREEFRKIIQSIDVKRDFIVCDSYSTKQSLLEAFPFIPEDHVEVVYIFVSESYFLPIENEFLQNVLDANNLQRDTYILLLFQINQRKNWNTLFTVLGEMAFKGSLDIDIAIVCSQSHLDQLQALLNECFIEDFNRLHFIHGPDDESLSALYKGARFTIYPSLYEGFGLPVLEAMASGCPTLAHNGSSVSEIAEDAAWLVDMASPKEIEAAVARLLTDSEIRTELRERGTEQAAKFTNDRVMDNYIRVFDLFWDKYLAASKIYHTIRHPTHKAANAGKPTTPVPSAKQRPAAILGNGPSLRELDFKKSLRAYDTFGMNAAYRYWDRINWYPDYYSCLDTAAGLSYQKDIARLIERSDVYGISGFLLRRDLIEDLGEIGHHPKVTCFEQLKAAQNPFCAASKIITESGTVAWAASLGYKDVVLCGMDEIYVEHNGMAADALGLSHEITQDDAADNHYFFADYLRKGDRYSAAHGREFIMESWRSLQPALQRHQVCVINASKNSDLELFPKCTFEQAERQLQREHGVFFPNRRQKVALKFYDLTLGRLMTPVGRQQFRTQPNAYFTESQHPANLWFKKILSLLGPVTW